MIDANAFICWWFAKYVIGDLRCVTGVADTDPKPVEFAIVAELGDGVAQAVMAAVTATAFVASGACWDV